MHYASSEYSFRVHFSWLLFLLVITMVNIVNLMGSEIAERTKHQRLSLKEPLNWINRGRKTTLAVDTTIPLAKI